MIQSRRGERCQGICSCSPLGYLAEATFHYRQPQLLSGWVVPQGACRCPWVLEQYSFCRC